MNAPRPIEIEILRLGPVRDSRIELMPLTVFTGESGLGKSYAGFVCHYLFHIFTSVRMQNYFEERAIDVVSAWDNSRNGDTVLTVNVADVIAWMEQDCIRYIGYLVGNPNLQGEVKFHLDIPEKELPLVREEIIQGIEGHEELYYRLSYNGTGFNIMARQIQMDKLYFGVLLRTVLNKFCFGESSLLFENVIFPPARGSVMDTVSKPAFRSGMYEEFFKFKEELLSSRYKDFKPGDHVLAQAGKVIGGSLSTENGEIFYHTDHNLSIPLSAAASSVKELSPYLLWLTTTPVIFTGILFEEPEAHLHPSRQQAVADTFGYLIRMGCFLTITTHSDYLLKRINQLGRIERLYYTHLGAINTLLGKEGLTYHSLIDFDKTRAYLLVSNGDGTSHTERIDSEDGIAFTSFETVIDREFDLTEEIERIEGVASDNQDVF